MKIQYALMSCNSNPMYLDFWPIVSKVWKLKFNIHPVLIYVDEKEINLDKTFGTVIIKKPLKNFSLIFQSQFARIWYTQFFPNDTCITSDTDMIPLSSWFFIDRIKKINENEYVLSTADDYGFNICYNIALGKTFYDFLELEEKWENQMEKFKHIDWSTDEKYIEEKIKNKKYLRLTGHSMKTRIDRSNWNYNPSLLKMGYYYDSHLLRPYTQYKYQIDNLLKNI